MKRINHLHEIGTDDVYQLPIKALFESPVEDFDENLDAEGYKIIGLSPTDEELIVYHDIDMSEFEDARTRASRDELKGWHTFFHTDDWSWTVYHDSKPVGGFYCSTRGSLYQAGVYRKSDDSFWFKTNLKSGEPSWVQAQVIVSEIAAELLTGQTFDPEDLKI